VRLASGFPCALVNSRREMKSTARANPAARMMTAV
jgi:hypothetical protein